MSPSSSLSHVGTNAQFSGSMTPLNARVPPTRNANPPICKAWKLSQPMMIDSIQTSNVRQVSIVDLDVAFKREVSVIPKKLNNEMENMMEIDV